MRKMDEDIATILGKMRGAHRLYLHHELSRVQCELAGGKEGWHGRKAARWKARHDGLRERMRGMLESGAGVKLGEAGQADQSPS